MKHYKPLGDILIVDDNADNIRFLESILVEQGYRVRAALNGTAALAIVAASPPQLILLDICMPEPNGFSVCEQLKSEPAHRDIPVVFLSGLQDATARAQGFRCGAADYLIKPFDCEELLARVRMHIYQRELHDQTCNQSRQALLVKDTNSRFLATASHDLRQPLEAMRLLCEALQSEVSAGSVADNKPTSTLAPEVSGVADNPGESSRRESNPCLPDPVKIQHLSSSIARALDNLQSLVDNLLDASALDSGGIVPTLQWFPIRDLFTAIERDLQPQAQARGLVWSCLYCDGCIYSDPMLLERIVRNLLDNALKYTLHGTVGLRANSIDDSIELIISDTGAGLTQDQQQAMFEAFHRPDAAPVQLQPSQGKGLGLGLSIIQRLCQLLNHSLHVESQPGQGTKMTVIITGHSLQPVDVLVPSSDALNIVRQNNKRMPDQGRVLLIDADSKLGDKAFALLIEWGYNAQRMSPAQYQIAGQSMPLEYELLVLISGDVYECVLRSLRNLPGSKLPSTPLIVLGRAPVSNLGQVEHGTVLHLDEPLKPAQFRSAIRASLRA